MQFSDTTNLQGLYQDAQDLAGSDSNDFLISRFTRSANYWYYQAVIEFWKYQCDWRFDDLNQSSDSDDDVGKPVATTNLTNSTRTYSLPTNALRIRRVEVKGQDGIWHVVHPYDEREIGISQAEFFKTDGRPLYYVLEGNKLRLFPAPDNGVSVTLTNGLRIFFDREVDEFTAADTTQEPGLPEPFHRILSYGGAMDYCISAGASRASQAQKLERELLKLFQSLREFASGRHENTQKRPVIEPRREHYN